MTVTTSQIRSLIRQTGITGTGNEIKTNFNEKRYPQQDPLGSQINALADSLQVANPSWNEGRCVKTALVQLTALISLIETTYGIGESVTTAEVNAALDTITDPAFARTIREAFSTVLNEITLTKFANPAAVRSRLSELGV